MLHGLTERKGLLLWKCPTSELNTESAVCPAFFLVPFPAHWALRWNFLSSRLLELMVFLLWESVSLGVGFESHNLALRLCCRVFAAGDMFRHLPAPAPRWTLIPLKPLSPNKQLFPS